MLKFQKIKFWGSQKWKIIYIFPKVCKTSNTMKWSLQWPLGLFSLKTFFIHKCWLFTKWNWVPNVNFEYLLQRIQKYLLNNYNNSEIKCITKVETHFTTNIGVKKSSNALSMQLVYIRFWSSTLSPTPIMGKLWFLVLNPLSFVNIFWPLQCMFVN